MIYDCFTFFNELDLLEIRLNVLSPVVDKFVLVEAAKTFTGKSKEFVFENNKERFYDFLDKIEHIKVDDMPMPNCAENDALGNNWLLETFQRDAIMRGLSGCSFEDIIIISDLDEIPSPAVITKYLQDDVHEIWVLKQMLMYYFVNNSCFTDPIWRGSRLGRYKNLLYPEQDLPVRSYYQFSKKGLPSYFRFCNGRDIDNAGWHFSYCGGVDAIIKKREAISEQQYNNADNMLADSMREAIKKGKDIYGRNQFRYAPIRLNSSFPEYLLNNQEKYKHLIVNTGCLQLYISTMKIVCYNVTKTLMKVVLKIICIFVPVRAWRKKIRGIVI